VLGEVRQGMLSTVWCTHKEWVCALIQRQLPLLLRIGSK
jgi:hypothetical protein